MKNLQISVPQAVVSGGSAVLECTYDLEGDLLYSVKWFRGKTEFYRYVPKENPRTRTFASSGITVDVSTFTSLLDRLLSLSSLRLFITSLVISRVFKPYTPEGHHQSRLAQLFRTY
ncbi:hypothetical protein WDU94_015210 [Cyamophila willieti]